MASDASALADLLRPAHRVLLFTGAGISTGSGIRDYRGPQGVWNTRAPVDYGDFMANESARVAYWEEKAEAWDSFRLAEPNAAHLAAVRLERADRLEALVTQNIDGLHDRAGTSPERLIEIHGTNTAVECQTCKQRSDPAAAYASFAETGVAPRCDRCGGFLKPATISFGQSLVEDDLRRSAVAAEETDLVISLGSTLSVHPAASIPLLAARRGVPYAIINRGATEQDHRNEVTLRIEGDVTEVFPAAVEAALAG